MIYKFIFIIIYDTYKKKCDSQYYYAVYLAGFLVSDFCVHFILAQK